MIRSMSLRAHCRLSLPRRRDLLSDLEYAIHRVAESPDCNRNCLCRLTTLYLRVAKRRHRIRTLRGSRLFGKAPRRGCLSSSQITFEERGRAELIAALEEFERGVSPAYGCCMPYMS